ncbi:hypothetical protein SDC9_84656 [bioreactor metagenome]|uniref:Uncharacterized protein n=1 Tax=bioreactor metagenome TaxID=1076179 RepID=A0A644ZH70_9ZZZZ
MKNIFEMRLKLENLENLKKLLTFYGYELIIYIKIEILGGDTRLWGNLRNY